MVKRSVILVFLWIVISPTGICEVVMPKIFSNHMVLQRDQPITLWGWGYSFGIDIDPFRYIDGAS